MDNSLFQYLLGKQQEQASGPEMRQDPAYQDNSQMVSDVNNYLAARQPDMPAMDLNPPPVQTMPPSPALSALLKGGMADSLAARSGDDMAKAPLPSSVPQQSANVPAITPQDAPIQLRAHNASPQMSDPQLLQALTSGNNLASFAMMGKGAERIGAALTHTKSDPGYLNEAIEQSGKPLENLMTARKSEAQQLDFQNAKDKADPNSPSSQFYRDTMKEFSRQSGINIKIPDNISALEMEKIYPNIINIVNAKEARDAKIEMMKMSAGAKKEATADKLSKAFKDDLDPNKARGGNLAKSQAMINSADRVDALFKQFPSYNIPKGQSIELSSAIAGLINGGSAQSQHQIDSLTPQTMRGNANAIAGWLTNHPTGLEQQKFMKMMHETALRERDVAENQVKSAQIQRLGAHKAYKKIDPEGYEDQLSRYGIDPSTIDDNGRYIGKGTSANPLQSETFKSKLESPEIKKDPRDTSMVQKYNSMSDKDPQKASLGQILKKKGLI